MIRAIAAALKAVFMTLGRWCAKTGTWVWEKSTQFAVGGIEAVAAAPGAIASMLASGRGGMPGPAPQAGHQADDAREIAEVMEGIEARRGARETLRSMRRHSPVSLEAELVHRYAAADSHERDDIDLDELPPHVADWLESLSERHLQHLAQSVEICEAAVSGHRTGVIGMPVPVRPTNLADVQPSAPIGTFAQVVGDPYAFSARVAAAKGARRDRQPH